MYDIAIVGAGPAGASLARMVGRNHKVLVVDRRALLTPFNGSSQAKSCGGLLAPDAQEIMGRLSLSLPRDVLVGPQIFTVRTIDLSTTVERFYQRFYINIEREKFDRWLVSLIPAQVEVRDGCLCRALEREEGGFKLHLTQGGENYTERARLIIGADGAQSRVRKLAFPDVPLPAEYIAIQEGFVSEKSLPYFSAIFDPEITDFYAWTIQKEDMMLIGAALPRGQEAWRKFALLKDKLQNYGYTFERKVRQDGAFIARPLSTKQLCTGKNGIGLIGEAAGWISPSSAEGMSYAMKSAYIAANILNSRPDDFCAVYERESRRLRQNILLKNLKSPAMYNTTLRNLVMRSGLQSMKVVESD